MPIEFHRDPSFVEHRRRARASVAMETTVRERGRTAVSARVVDFSGDGCRIESGGIPLAGTQVWVRLPELESQSAWIAWSTGSVAGVVFERPLHPAVAARFAPAANDVAPSGPAAENVFTLQPLLSRREQILRGDVREEPSPLIRCKQPTGRSLTDTIIRNVRRLSEDRHETRYSDAVTTGPMALTVAGQPALVSDLAPSGLGIRSEFAADIGDTVQVEFSDVDPIEARVVWRRPGAAGLALPPKSIDLSES